MGDGLLGPDGSLPTSPKRPVDVDFGGEQFRPQLQDALLHREQVALREQFFEVRGIAFRIAVPRDAQRFLDRPALGLRLRFLFLQFRERGELGFNLGERREHSALVADQGLIPARGAGLGQRT